MSEMVRGSNGCSYPAPMVRFRSHVVIADNGCHIWQRERTHNGYGRFYFAGKRSLAHRWIYEQVNGPIPDGMQIDHLCRNRACCNPEHLEVVTPLENTRRGLSYWGDTCPKGHSMADAYSTYIPSRGNINRSCRECRNAYDRARRVQRKASK